MPELRSEAWLIPFNDIADEIRQAGSIVIAFSGGVDSAALAHLAFSAIGDRANAVTVLSETVSEGEAAQAGRTAAQIGISHVLKRYSICENASFIENTPDRCYFCRTRMYTILEETAKEFGAVRKADGANHDDLDERRPGLRAAREHEIWHPFMEHGVGKADIRRYARYHGLEAADRPSNPCLTSRMPYGERIEVADLRMVELAERHLHELGFNDVRVRHLGDTASVEVPADRIEELSTSETLGNVRARLREIGFTRMVVDPKGYRTGSMDEAL